MIDQKVKKCQILHGFLFLKNKRAIIRKIGGLHDKVRLFI